MCQVYANIPTFDAHMRKGVYGFYRRIELSQDLIIIANSDVLFLFKNLQSRQNDVVLRC